MNFLIVYPMHQNRFWNFERILKFFSNMSSFPPLVLLTIASMLPKEWNKKLIDMNANDLNDEDILWADYVFINAMPVQSKSADKVIEKCKKLNAKTVASGSLFTNSDDYYQKIDHLVFDEAEITLPQFVSDLGKGKPKQKYTSEDMRRLQPAL